MLKMIINQPSQNVESRKSDTVIEFSGDLKSLLVELTYGISCLHCRLKSAEPHGPELGKMFRKYLIQALVDPDAPIWNYTAEDIGGAGLTIVEEKGGTYNA